MLLSDTRSNTGCSSYVASPELMTMQFDWSNWGAFCGGTDARCDLLESLRVCWCESGQVCWCKLGRVCWCESGQVC